MRSSERMYLFQTWLQSVKEEQSVAVAESQPTSSSLSPCRTDRLHHGHCSCHPPLAARPTCFWTKPIWTAAQLLLLSVRRFIQIYICLYIYIYIWCVLHNRTKGKQALCISSNSVVRIPLSISVQKKFGFPGLRASRRNCCSPYSPAGTVLAHFYGEAEARSDF